MKERIKVGDLVQWEDTTHDGDNGERTETLRRGLVVENIPHDGEVTVKLFDGRHITVERERLIKIQ